ncbi:MAG: hypothetical protein KBT34_10280 [Prevotella sp.]|nr:hypothetical protein [Candidatus Prevotella equi]
MDIQEIKEEKARLAENICNLVTSFEEKTGVSVNDIDLSRKEVNTQGKLDTWYNKIIIDIDCRI